MGDRRRKWVRWTALCAVLAVCSVVCCHPGRAPWVIPFGLLSGLLVGHRLRRAKDRATVETLEGTGAVREGTAAPERIAVGKRQHALFLLGLAYAVLAGASWILWRHVSGSEGFCGFAWAIQGACTTACLVFWLWCFTSVRVVAEVSAEGVTRRSLLKSKRRSVSWAEIARCTIRSEPIPLGRGTAPEDCARQRSVSHG